LYFFTGVSVIEMSLGNIKAEILKKQKRQENKKKR
jgi:hypothetical protein